MTTASVRGVARDNSICRQNTKFTMSMVTVYYGDEYLLLCGSVISVAVAVNMLIIFVILSSCFYFYDLRNGMYTSAYGFLECVIIGFFAALFRTARLSRHTPGWSVQIPGKGNSALHRQISGNSTV